VAVESIKPRLEKFSGGLPRRFISCLPSSAVTIDTLSKSELRGSDITMVWNPQLGWVAVWNSGILFSSYILMSK
jgi:hypothetical protein